MLFNFLETAFNNNKKQKQKKAIIFLCISNKFKFTLRRSQFCSLNRRKNFARRHTLFLCFCFKGPVGELPHTPTQTRNIRYKIKKTPKVAPSQGVFSHPDETAPPPPPVHTERGSRSTHTRTAKTVFASIAPFCFLNNQIFFSLSPPCNALPRSRSERGRPV